MNIIDLLGDSKPSTNDFSKKIAIKTEIQKIENRISDITKSVMDLLADESKYIKNSLSYCSNTPDNFGLTDDEKNMLIQKLCDAVKKIPEKIEKIVYDLSPNYNKETFEKDESKPEEVKKVEVVAVEPPVAKAPDYFGY